MVTDHLLIQFREIFNGAPWLDETFAKKIDNLSEEDAFRTPYNLHSVAEIISHLLEWRKEIISRLEGNPRKMKFDSPENWITNETLKKHGFKSLWQDFEDSQQELYKMLQTHDDHFLSQPWSNVDNEYLLRGLLHHDIYHLGQIGLILRMNAVEVS